MSKLEQYVQVLNRLPIVNPTEEDFLALCPHLTPEQVKTAFAPEAEYDCHVAIPPMKVRYGHLVVHYSPGDAEDEPYLSYAFPKRTLESYADHKSHGDVFSNILYQEEAMKYAEQFWPERLILDTWVSYVEFIIQDPRELVSGYPHTKFTVRCTTSEKWGQITNDHSAPKSQLINKSIVELTIDEYIGDELKGARVGYTEFNCANCGAGLSLTGCKKCHHNFKDNFFRTGWNTPLPSKVIALLETHGHQFGMDPKIAQTIEHQLWAAKYK